MITHGELLRDDLGDQGGSPHPGVQPMRDRTTVQDIRANLSQHQTLQWNLSGVATAFSDASALLAKKVLVCEELRKFEQEWAVSKSGIQKTLERFEPVGTRRK